MSEDYSSKFFSFPFAI